MSDYSMKDLLDKHFDIRARDFLHTSFPAEITRLNSSVSVDVQPLVSTMLPDGSVRAYSELYNVRLYRHTASDGNVFISLPTKVGDKVWVFVSERDTASLFADGLVGSTTEKTHDLSDCFCIPSFFTDVSPPEYDPNHLVIANQSTTITVKHEGIDIKTTTVNIEASDMTINTANLNVKGNTNIEALNVSGTTSLSGDIKHKGVDIGKDHKHIAVQVGTGESGIVKT